MATDIIARGMITEYKSGTNIDFKENEDGSVTISASGNVSSEDTIARGAIDNHKLDKNNPHNVTAEQVGLGNVNNTADLDKPISTAVQTALDDKANAKHTHKKSDITDFPNSLPANGGNADTVNNHTVDSDVPADAVFTDTTYEAATQTEDGLMSAADKTKLDGIEDGANYYTKTEIDAKLDEKAGKDAMTGATSSADGMSGLVPSPSAGNQEKFLRADGTWDIAFSYDYIANNWLSPVPSPSIYWHSPASQEEAKATGRYVAKPVKDLVNGEDGYNARIITVFFPYSNTTNNIKGLYLYEYSQAQVTYYHNSSLENQGFRAGDVATFLSYKNNDNSGNIPSHHLIYVKRADSIIYTDFLKEFIFSDSFYETFNSNLKIKHGNMSFTRVTSATQYDVTFDTPFENVPNIQLSYTDSSASSSSYVSLISSSKDGFSVKGSYLTGFNWLAIGV